MKNLAAHAVRDSQFAEIYHPEDGRIYGGVQEGGGKMLEWHSCSWQTWSASAYLAMVMYGLCGLCEDGTEKNQPLSNDYTGHFTLRLNRRGRSPVYIEA